MNLERGISLVTKQLCALWQVVTGQVSSSSAGQAQPLSCLTILSPWAMGRFCRVGAGTSKDIYTPGRGGRFTSFSGTRAMAAGLTV